MVLFIGGMTGFLAGSLGLGGGFILVPLLVIAGFPFSVAVGSSLAYIVFVGLAGAIQHRRQGSCSVRLALVMICGGVITAQLGAIATTFVGSAVLEGLLTLLLLGVGVRTLFVKGGEVANEGEAYVVNVPKGIAVGGIVGFLSGLLGVGGGFILIPLMILVMRVPVRVAMGTSLLTVTGLAASGAVRHWLMGNGDLLLISVLVVGGVVGSPLGATAAKRTSGKVLRLAFCGMLFLFATGLLVSRLIHV
ncbi:MAG: sulfite exporter TauE/SafE family protein [Candidatus Bathyarchaeota archaeon]